MFTDRLTYSDFARAEEGIATNVLAARLEALRQHGIIRRRGEGKGAQYALTQKGLDLLPAMLELISWSARYDGRTAAPPEFVSHIRRDRDRVAEGLRQELRRRHGL